MKITILFISCILIILLGASVYADQDTGDVFKAIVGIRVRVPADAYTARTLGTERQGSGVVVDADGHILTIGYLVVEAESIDVLGPEGKTISAALVGYDFNSGLGLIRADEPAGTRPMDLGRSSALKEGERLIVASYGGLVQAVLVISRKEFAGYWEYLLEDAIYTAPPHENFGGAALISSDGRLLGIGSIYTQVYMPGIGIIPSNMFVPIDLLKPIFDDLISKGRPQRPPRPWLGLTVFETGGRVFIMDITEGGPSEEAGLLPGDIILTVNGIPVTGMADFFRKVWALGNAGVMVSLKILHETQIHELTVQSADRYQFIRLTPQRPRGTTAKQPNMNTGAAAHF